MISILAIVILSGSRSRDQELQIPTVVPKCQFNYSYK
jgi:hypothetical protein